MAREAHCTSSRVAQSLINASSPGSRARTTSPSSTSAVRSALPASTREPPTRSTPTRPATRPQRAPHSQWSSSTIRNSDTTAFSTQPKRPLHSTPQTACWTTATARRTASTRARSPINPRHHPPRLLRPLRLRLHPLAHLQILLHHQSHPPRLHHPLHLL